MQTRRLVLGGIAVAIFALAFLYRFNALGGALGGFDNDHFLYYVRAKQVAHGERPLRDFADAGLQGAWPALTYELPALAQRWGGETLLSEAVLCVGLIAVSLALMCVLAGQWAGIPAAIAVTILTLFLGTKLYSYSKLLVFAVACALFFHYARRPDSKRVLLLAAWSAIAFLFRHDFLVYLVPAIAVLVTVMTWPNVRLAARQGLVYAGALALLLAGPLYSIHRFAGIGTYFAANLAMGQRETERTDIPWPAFSGTGDGLQGFLADEGNAVALVYYLVWAIPVLAIAASLRARDSGGWSARQTRALLLSLAVLALALDRFFLRGNLAARFADLGAPTAVLAAFLFTSRRLSGTTARAAAAATATVGLALVLVAANSLGSISRELDTTGLSDSVDKIERRFSAAAAELRELPAAAPTGANESRDVVAYLRACTRPEDRVLVIASMPEIAAMANRPFAAGQPTFTPGFYTSDLDQRRMLQWLSRQSVPVVVTETEDVYLEDLAPEFPLLDQFVRTFYEPVGELPGLRGEPMRILVARQRVGHRWEATSWPCFS